MDFQRRKLFLAVSILAVGMVIALAWHAWQGWGLGRSYPYNTFLFLPKVRFSDLIEVLKCANSPSPYEHGSYFPATYPAFRPLVHLHPVITIFLFISVTSLGLWALTMITTFSLIFDHLQPLRSGLLLLATSVVLTFSYPLLLGIDRGNIELLMALFAATALLCFSHRHCGWGLLCLFPCICFKFYPVLLLLLFLRPRHFLQFLVVIFAFVAANVGSLFLFAPTIHTSLAYWKQNMQTMNMLYVIHFWGAAGTASPWNAAKAFIGTCCYLVSDHLRPSEAIVLQDAYLHPLFSFYSYLALSASALIVFAAVFVEREFFRRAILLLILLTIILPSGGEYRLIYAHIGLIVLILLPGRRRHDLLAVGLLAFVVIPKREIFLPFLGFTDSTFRDIPLAVLLNAPCLLLVLALLLSDSCKASSRLYARLRFAGLLHHVFSWKGWPRDTVSVR